MMKVLFVILISSISLGALAQTSHYKGVVDFTSEQSQKMSLKFTSILKVTVEGQKRTYSFTPRLYVRHPGSIELVLTPDAKGALMGAFMEKGKKISEGPVTIDKSNVVKGVLTAICMKDANCGGKDIILIQPSESNLSVSVTSLNQKNKPIVKLYTMYFPISDADYAKEEKLPQKNMLTPDR